MGKELGNLFEQTKDLKNIGQRLSGEPEVLHDLEDQFRLMDSFPIVRRQIQAILEYVPSVFPEDWASPESYDDLTSEQKEAYAKIYRKGIFQCPGPVIQEVIELAVKYRTAHPNKS